MFMYLFPNLRMTDKTIGHPFLTISTISSSIQVEYQYFVYLIGELALDRSRTTRSEGIMSNHLGKPNVYFSLARCLLVLSGKEF